MNYIRQLNEFYSTLDYKPLSANAIAIYFVLLQIANKTGWIDKFRVANTVLMSKCDLDMQKLIRARTSLINKGYITYVKGKNQTEAPIYSINKLYSNIANDIADNTVDNIADDKPNDNINKQNETKQYIDHFELIWDKYPNKQGKAKALEYYLQWIKGRNISGITRKLTDKQMWYAVMKYAKECKEKQIEQQYIKHGDTFFNKAILDYVEVEDEQISGN